MVIRALHPYEQLCAGMNISVALTLQSEKYISSDVVSQALDLAAHEHPYLRMVLEMAGDAVNSGTILSFVERKHEPFVNLDFLTSLEDPGRVLNRLINEPKPSDNTTLRAVLRTEQSSPHEKNISGIVYPAQLYLLFNHGGIDAPGAFSVAHSVCHYLGQLLDGADPAKLKQSIQQRPFQDILARISTTPPPPRPVVPENFMPFFPALPAKEREKDDSSPHISAYWFELDSNETTSLISNCKSNGVSIQGAISAAAIVAVAKEQSVNYPLPQTVVVQAPANMRQAVDPPVDPSDCVCASAALWWEQEASGGQFLWEVAAAATRAVQDEVEKKSGIEWWQRLQGEMWAPPYTVQASNVGICPVQEHYSSSLSVQRVLMLGGSYGSGSPETAATMTHAHTFAGRLQLECAAAQPGTGEKRAKRFAETQFAVLKALAGDAARGMTMADAIMKL